MQKPAKSWLRSDIAVLNVKRGFFKSDLQAEMHKYTFELNKKVDRPSLDKETWPYGKILGSGYGQFKPVDVIKSIRDEENALENYKKLYGYGTPEYNKNRKLYRFNKVHLRTGHSMIVDNERLRKEMITETAYDLTTQVEREIFIDNLLGYKTGGPYVEFPKEYLAAIGIFTKNNQYRDAYQQIKPHAMLPTIKPTIVWRMIGIFHRSKIIVAGLTNTFP